MEERVIITVVGKDQIGIAACVTTALSDNHVNILDINQTIMQGFFTMFIVGQKKDHNPDLTALRAKLEALGDEMGFKITVQNEAVFQYMHRI